MANVKNSKRLKNAPKRESPKKRGRPKTKKSLTGSSKTIVQADVQQAEVQQTPTKESEVVMKRPSDKVIMTADEKVQYILKNGHQLKEKFIIAKPPKERKKRDPPVFFRKTIDTDRPLITKSGRLKKKTKCNIKLIDSILKNELMINDSGNVKHPNTIPQPVPPPPVAISPVPNGVNNNNNDDEKSSLNETFQDFSDSDDSEYIISDDSISNSSDNISEDASFSDDSIVKKQRRRKPKKKLEPIISEDATISDNKKQKNKKTKKKLEPVEEKPKPTHITLRNGVVLKLQYFECDHCGKSFNRKTSLVRHMFMHLNIKPFTCLYCPQEFRSRYNMQVHMKRYHHNINRGLFVCNYCGETFVARENLKLHILTHTNRSSSLYKCIYCSKVFTQNILLKQHEKKHMVNGRHACTLCSMTYRCRKRLYLHVKSHLKIKDYICQYCGKGFLRNESLVRHFEVFHGGQRLVCPICSKNLKGHLTEHMRTHEKKRPHKCPDCGQRFTQSTQMNVHRRAHTGARPYPCRVCNRFFSHSNALMLHIRRHTGEKPFPCAMCPMSFSQLPHMKTHMLKIHKKVNPYKCSHCDTFFKLKAQLEVHEKTCKAGNVGKSKNKNKMSKNGEEEAAESMMSLSRMRFLLALLFTMITTKEKLNYLGFNKRLIDEILVESLEAMEKTPCKDKTMTPLKRLKTNIEMLLLGTVPKDQMEMFKKENKSTEDILELLTNEKRK